MRVTTTNGGLRTAEIASWEGPTFPIFLKEPGADHHFSISGDRLKVVYDAEADELAFIPPPELDQGPAEMSDTDLVRWHEWGQRHLAAEMRTDSARALFDRTHDMATERLKRGLFQEG